MGRYLVDSSVSLLTFFLLLSERCVTIFGSDCAFIQVSSEAMLFIHGFEMRGATYTPVILVSVATVWLFLSFSSSVLLFKVCLC